MILIRCGLRVSDALQLQRECIVFDADQAPYLRYFNHKMNREARVPIDEELRDQITAQQAQAGQAPVLFPRPTKNPRGRHPIASADVSAVASHTAGWSSTWRGGLRQRRERREAQ